MNARHDEIGAMSVEAIEGAMRVWDARVSRMQMLATGGSADDGGSRVMSIDACHEPRAGRHDVRANLRRIGKGDEG
jgi:hypothetical protein